MVVLEGSFSAKKGVVQEIVENLWPRPLLVFLVLPPLQRLQVGEAALIRTSTDGSQDFSFLMTISVLCSIINTGSGR
ncbi:hypothetical protein F0562_030268 [Nyssa sinensis]|uniref:Uncharacterized protein n=1 Tax=Nyssa sinensis TaxID=561372 RepID=A0A5J5AVY5_9ASTE|nr:hypothetical protein F0562_030268 [Nyssa sinensis]